MQNLKRRLEVLESASGDEFAWIKRLTDDELAQRIEEARLAVEQENSEACHA